MITSTELEKSQSCEGSRNEYANDKVTIGTRSQLWIWPEYPGSQIKKGNGMN